jgi:hypothetical protein
MPTLVHDCPRCGARGHTFDVAADVYAGQEYDWQSAHEVCAVCRRCHKPTLFRVVLQDYGLADGVLSAGKLSGLTGDLEPRFSIERYVSLADVRTSPPPADLPEDISKAFQEGATCISIGCINAAATMFRLCLDLATKGLLPDEGAFDGPDKNTRRNLAPRLRWLFDNKLLSADLRPLSAAVKDNGDDGAHSGILTADEASDLLEFARAFLERLYTEPAKLAAATQRVADRRATAAKRV